MDDFILWLFWPCPPLLHPPGLLLDSLVAYQPGLLPLFCPSPAALRCRSPPQGGVSRFWRRLPLQLPFLFHRRPLPLRTPPDLICMRAAPHGPLVQASVIGDSLSPMRRRPVGSLVQLAGTAARPFPMRGVRTGCLTIRMHAPPSGAPMHPAAAPRQPPESLLFPLPPCVM